MAYTSFAPGSSTNLVQTYKSPFGVGSRWLYVSTDGTSLVSASSYISDAAKYGVKAGDIIEQYNSVGNIGASTLPVINSYLVTTVRGSSTSTPSADLSAGRALTS